LVNFLQPVWLYTMLGVAVPIAIHLWNVQQGKILKVGSVALLTKDAVTTTSRIKLHELLLLLLRCLFIILLSLLLAQPQWHGNNNRQQGWVLVDKNNAQQTYTHYKQQIDSLLQAGFKLHYFNAGFETADVQQLSNTINDSAVTNYWSTLQQLQHTAGAQIPLYIFTNAYIKNIAGNRPAATPNIHWASYAPGDTASYIAGNYSLLGDSIMVVTAHTAAGGTYNTYNPVNKALAGTTGYDTSTWNITIYTKTYTADAAYIKAAVDAIKQVSNRKIALTIAANALQLPRHNHWLFWLSADTIPAWVTSQNIFKYAEGKTENVQSWIKLGEDATESTRPVALHKRIADTGHGYTKIIWADGYGNALLAETKQGVYRFFSRFDASWNDLPWSSNFPQVIYSLLFAGNDVSLNADDKRLVTGKQLQPLINQNKTNVQPSTAGTDASPLFWLLAFAIFFIERIIALRAKKERAYVQ